MRKFEAIILSETAPSTRSIWFKDNKLYFFDGKWKPIEGTFSSTGDDLTYNLGEIDANSLPATFTLRDPADIEKFKKVTSIVFGACDNGVLHTNFKLDMSSINIAGDTKSFSPSLDISMGDARIAVNAHATLSEDKVDISIGLISAETPKTV